MGGDESSFPTALESELFYGLPSSQVGNSVTADEQHSRRKPTKHLASHVHLPLDAAASQGSFVVVFFLPTVVPSQLFGSYMQSWQLYTKSTSPLTAVTRSELKDPKSHLPTGTDRSHAVLPPPTRVHHSSHTKPANQHQYPCTKACGQPRLMVYCCFLTLPLLFQGL